MTDSSFRVSRSEERRVGKECYIYIDRKSVV